MYTDRNHKVGYLPVDHQQFSRMIDKHQETHPTISESKKGAKAFNPWNKNTPVGGTVPFTSKLCNCSNQTNRTHNKSYG